MTKNQLPVASSGADQIQGIKTGETFSLRSTLFGSKFRNLCAGFSLFLLTILFFADVLSSERYVIPWDMIDYYFPALYFSIESLKQGSLPLWNPHILAGFPAIADPETGFFYPPSLLLYFFSKNSVFTFNMVEWLLAFHYFLTGLFMWIFLRSLLDNKYAAYVGAVIYMFSGYLAAHAQHLGPILGATWIPLIFFFSRKAILEKNHRHAAKAGICLALQILAGYPQTTFSTLLALLLYFVWESVWKANRNKSNKPLFRSAVSFAIILVTGVSIAAIQLLPTIELYGLSVRSDPPADYLLVEEFPLNPVFLVTAVVANFFGGLIGTQSWFFRDLTETHFYLGIVPVLLIVVGMRFMTKRKFIWLIIGGFFMFLALGGYTIFPRFYFLLSPYLNLFVRSSNYFLVTNFCLAVIAAYGMQVIWREKSLRETAYINRSLRIIPVVLVLLFAIFSLALLIDNGELRVKIISLLNHIMLHFVFLAAAVILIQSIFKRKLHPLVTKSLLLFLVIIDLFTFNSHQSFNAFHTDRNIIPSKSSIEGDTQTISFLKEDQNNNYRVATFEAGSTYNNAGSIAGFYNVFGYTSMALRGYRDYLAKLGITYNRVPQLDSTVDLASNYLNLLSVKYLFISSKLVREKRMLLPPEQYEVAYSRDWIVGYRNKKFIPRAFISRKAILVEEKQMESFMRSPSFAPQQHILIDLRFKDQIPSEFVTTTVQEDESELDSSSSEDIAILQSSGNFIKMEANVDSPGFVVLTDVFYPGWKAYINGKEREIIPAYGIFRAVPLEKGKHSLEFRYEPKLVYLGMAITLLSVLFVAGYLVIPYSSLRRAGT